MPTADALLHGDFATLPGLVAAHAGNRRDTLAPIHGDRRPTCRELDHATDAVAAALQSDDVPQRQAVAIVGAMTIEYARVFLGALRAGHVPTPLAPHSTAEQLAAMIADCGASLLLLDAKAAAALGDTPVAARRVPLDGGDAGVALADFIADGGAPQAVTIAPSDPFDIIYSSGTTGVPKAIVQSHAVRWAHIARNDALALADAVTMIATPLCSNATPVSFLPTLGWDGTCALVASAYPGKLDAVGKPLDGHDIRLIGDDGREVPIGGMGQVVGRSGAMMTGYHGRSEATSDAEWFDPAGNRYIRQGDVGRFDADGFLTLLDRKKDVIVSDGLNIYSSDIEGVLDVHSCVAGETVVGIPSDASGETPMRFCVPVLGAEVEPEAILDWVNARAGRTQRLSAYRPTADRRVGAQRDRQGAKARTARPLSGRIGGCGMTLGELIAAMTPVDGGFRVTIPANWLQGRTAYGGLSTALALHAAKASDIDLPPLRSALVAFVGPLAGEVLIEAKRLRRGRNAAFIEATISSEAGLGFRATFVFMADIASSIDYDALVRSPHRAPAPGVALYTGPPGFFTGNFQFKDLEDHAGAAEWLRWARLIDRDGIDPEVALVAVADALPPAAYRLHQGQGAMSSLTWIVNVLTPRPETADGWWLTTACTERAVGGYSSQRMTVWNAGGMPVVDAMQGVAVFV